MIFLGGCYAMNQIDIDQLSRMLNRQHPFDYNLDIILLRSQDEAAQVTIVCHGYGDSNRLTHLVQSFETIPDHLIGFNFPDHDIDPESYEQHVTSKYGSIDELLPLRHTGRFRFLFRSGTNRYSRRNHTRDKDGRHSSLHRHLLLLPMGYLVSVD